jgi:hypothetical protein
MAWARPCGLSAASTISGTGSRSRGKWIAGRSGVRRDWLELGIDGFARRQGLRWHGDVGCGLHRDRLPLRTPLLQQRGSAQASCRSSFRVYQAPATCVQVAGNWRNLMGLVFSVTVAGLLMPAVAMAVRFPMDWAMVVSDW